MVCIGVVDPSRKYYDDPLPGPVTVHFRRYTENRSVLGNAIESRIFGKPKVNTRSNIFRYLPVEVLNQNSEYEVLNLTSADH